MITTNWHVDKYFFMVPDLVFTTWILPLLTPYIGGSWTTNDNEVEGELEQFNYNSTSAYVLLLAQYGNVVGQPVLVFLMQMIVVLITIQKITEIILQILEL